MSVRNRLMLLRTMRFAASRALCCGVCTLVSKLAIRTMTTSSLEVDTQLFTAAVWQLEFRDPSIFALGDIG